MSGVWGEVAAVSAAALWAVSSAFFTIEGRRTRPVIMNLVKTSSACLFFLILCFLVPPGFLGPSGDAGLPHWGAIAILALSGVIGVALADTFYFVSLARVGLRTTMILSLLSPIFAAGAAALAGEDLPGAIGAFGIALTLVGILVVVRAAPLESSNLGAATGTVSRTQRAARRGFLALALFGILAALGNALGIVIAKKAIQQVGVLPTSVIRLAGGTAGLLVLDLVRGRLRGTGGEVFRGLLQPRLLLASFLGTFLGFACFQVSIYFSSPPVTAALTSTSPLFAAPIAVHLLGERMRWPVALGMGVAVLGVVVLVLS